MKKYFLTLLLLPLFWVFSPAPVSNAAAGIIQYETATENLRVVCEQPCPYNRKQHRQAFLRLKHQLKRKEQKIGTPIDASLKPIEVHLAIDSTCPLYRQENVVAYSAKTKNGKALICLTQKIKDIIAGWSAFPHELTHQYFGVARSTGDEDLEELLVIWLSMYGSPRRAFNGPEPVHFCGGINLGDDVKRFCEKYDLAWDDVPEFIRLITEKKKEDVFLTNDEVIEALQAVRR